MHSLLRDKQTCCLFSNYFDFWFLIFIYCVRGHLFFYYWHTWKSELYLRQLLPYFHYVALRDQAQILRHGSKCPYTLVQLSGCILANKEGYKKKGHIYFLIGVPSYDISGGCKFLHRWNIWVEGWMGLPFMENSRN